MIIAIDSTTDVASVAIVEDGELIAEQTWHTGRNHTVQLLPTLEKLLETAGKKISDCTGVVVAKGPGSFNGLRVGVSSAKVLAFGLGVPIVGINSLEAAAYQYAGYGLPVCPVYNAGRDEVVTAVYRLEDGAFNVIREPSVMSVDALIETIEEKTLFCGERIPLIADSLKHALGGKAVICSPVTDIRRAAFLAELGIRRIAAGDIDDVATLGPVYLRRPPITQKKRK